jgi:hypothetical protein
VSNSDTTKNRSPYRPPCSGEWTGKIFLPRHYHFRASENGFPKYNNITQISYSNLGCTPSTQPPVSLPDCDQNCITNSCPGTETCEALAGCDTITCAPCSSQPCDYPCAACIGGISFPGVEGYASNNCFQLASPAAVVNRAACYKLGFKNVQAFKVWQGAPGFTDDCKCNPVTSAPPGTHYLDATYTYTVTNIDQSDITAYKTIATVSGSVAVNSNSGNVTLSGLVNQLDHYTAGAPGWCNGALYILDSTTPTTVSTPPVPVCPVAYSTIDDERDPSTGWGTLTTTVVTVSETAYTYAQTVSTYSGPDDPCGDVGTFLSGQVETYFAITLSTPYTASQCIADRNTLLAVIPLNNDASYPWRHDTAVSQAPLVTRDEAYSSPLNYIGASVGLTAYTGAILGALTSTGYDLFFNCAFANYLQGAEVDGVFDPYAWYVNSWGGFAPSWCPQATQWNNNFNATGLYGGAYAGNSGGSGFPFNVLPSSDYVGPEGQANVPIYTLGSFGQKWAEVILFVKPSHNFARPCGPNDRSAVNLITGCPQTVPYPFGPLLCQPASPAPENEWNDTGQKGDFVTRSFSWNNRDVGEYARIVAWAAAYSADPTYVCGPAPSLPPNPRGGSALVNIACTQRCGSYTNCCPNVICYSPNGEIWSSGVTLPFTDPAIDAEYGSFWQAEVDQWMIDPLFTPPPSPDCGGTLWKQDNGTCQPCVTNPETEIKTCYYIPPFEESRCTLPVNILDGHTAPALPSGITLGASTPGDGTWTGNFSGVPEMGGANCPTPWAFWINQLTTCCQTGEDCEMPPP